MNMDQYFTSHHLQPTSVQPTLVCFLTPGFFRYQATFRTVVVPQSAQRFTGYHLTHVHSHKSNNKHSIAAQVILGKLGEDARLAVRRVESAKLLTHVLDLAWPVEGTKQPLHHVDGTDQGQEHVPEPQEYEDLFIEEVDRQLAMINESTCSTVMYVQFLINKQMEMEIERK